MVFGLSRLFFSIALICASFGTLHRPELLMTQALLPVWILIAPLALVLADWLFASKATSMMSRQMGATYLKSPGLVTR